jgi:2-keto-4-pentenoate hydratase/2-oxohepta-3-ene-1,7-dioic acid hydratase in catechol pathway
MALVNERQSFGPIFSFFNVIALRLKEQLQSFSSQLMIIDKKDALHHGTRLCSLRPGEVTSFLSGGPVITFRFMLQFFLKSLFT